MTEEKIIHIVQQMDWIYSQSDTLYDLIPHIVKLASDLDKTPKGPHVDGVIGSINQIDELSQLLGHVFVQTSQPTTGQENQQPTNPAQTLEILTVQAMDRKRKKKKKSKC